MTFAGIGNFFWPASNSVNTSLPKDDPFAKIDEKNKGNSSSASEISTEPFNFLNFENGLEVAAGQRQKPGLNFTGECSSCRKVALIHKGFSDNEIFKVFEMKFICAEAQCSECRTSLVIKNVVLLECAYVITGEKESGQKVRTSNFAKTGRAMSFGTLEGEANSTHWKALSIRVEPLVSSEKLEKQSKSPTIKQGVWKVAAVLGSIALICFFVDRSQLMKKITCKNLALYK